MGIAGASFEFLRSRSPVLYIRLGGVVLMIAIIISGTLEREQDPATTLGWQVLMASLALAYGMAFWLNTEPFPQQRPWQKWMLCAQYALSIPFGTATVSLLTTATIPLVLRSRYWRPWMLAQVALVVGQTTWLIRSAIPRIPREVTQTEILAAVSSSAIESLAWQLFAFAAAVLIVRLNGEREKLARLNAELRGAQLLLSDASRLSERLRISRELHDSLGHHLTALNLQLEVAQHLPDDQLRPQLGQAQFLSRLVLADIRQAVSEWRAESSTALPEALRSLTTGTVAVDLKIEIEDRLPSAGPALAHALYRCAQEGITNTLKHGAARHITISLRRQEEHLVLEVADDGQGSAAVVPGNGLSGMEARMQEFGGSVRFETATAQGFRLIVTVPLPVVAA
ncbi:MAG: sensor histidine kinase [Acidobacteria bacterium]|nr:sensor histidine kinase [Acidobacteriota bacterium]